MAGSAAAVAALLPLLGNDYAQATVVMADDARLRSDRISYDAPGGKIGGYLTRLRDAAKRPAVIVIHENRGLNPHIEDVARRLALDGFLAFAVDMLSPVGGTPGGGAAADEDKARELIAALDLDATEKNLAAAVPFLQGHPESNRRVGAVGFCWGGGMVNRLAAASPDLAAGVAYYGRQIPAERVPGIRAALLLQYAGLDQPINSGIPAYEAALKAGGKRYTIQVYDGANHAFNNDTNAARYDKAAADLAWSRTVAFLKDTLGSPTPTSAASRASGNPKSHAPAKAGARRRAGPFAERIEKGRPALFCCRLRAL